MGDSAFASGLSALVAERRDGTASLDQVARVMSEASAGRSAGSCDRAGRSAGFGVAGDRKGDRIVSSCSAAGDAGFRIPVSACVDGKPGAPPRRPGAVVEPRARPPTRVEVDPAGAWLGRLQREGSARPGSLPWACWGHAARCRRSAARWRWARDRVSSVFVAGDRSAGGDLYAVPGPRAAPVVPITFSTVGEMRPALSPDGGDVAFLRGASLRDSTPGSVWVMNLLSGAERQVELPRGAGAPGQVGWTLDGRSLSGGPAGDRLYRVEAPPAEPRPQRRCRRRAGARRSRRWRCCWAGRRSPGWCRAPSRRDSASRATPARPGSSPAARREPPAGATTRCCSTLGRRRLMVRPAGPRAGPQLDPEWARSPPAPRQLTRSFARRSATEPR